MIERHWNFGKFVEKMERYETKPGNYAYHFGRQSVSRALRLQATDFLYLGPDLQQTLRRPEI